MVRIALILAAMVLFVGCSSQSFDLTQRAQAYDAFVVEQSLIQVDKIHSFQFEQWTGLGKQHLILYRRFNEPYLIALNKPCFDLNHASVISVNYHHNTLLAKFDSITVPNEIPVKCYIKSIHPLTKAQKKAILAIGKVSKNKR